MSQPTKSRTFTKGPARAAYTAYTIVSSVACLPAYLAYFTVVRPNKQWTFRQAFVNHMVRIVIDYMGVTETATSQMDKSQTGDFVRFEPAQNQKVYEGLLDNPRIQPVTNSAVWVPSIPKTPLKPGQFITLHLHGGAFVALSPADGAVQSGPRFLAEKLGTPVLMLDYRLSCNPNSQFPAALQDAITAYKSLLDMGYSSDQILVSGDSAGGNLALALLRYIAEHTGEEDSLPCPFGAALWSPWVNMGMSNDAIESNPNYKLDYLTTPLIAWGVREYVPPDQSPSGPYFSPAQHPFRTDARLFIHTGTSELLLDQDREVAFAFAGIKGNKVELKETANATHDIFASGKSMGFFKEQDEIVAAALQFFQD